MMQKQLWLLAEADPVGVEGAGFVDAFVGVGAEVVALGLKEVRRQPGIAVAVVVVVAGEEPAGTDAITSPAPALMPVHRVDSALAVAHQRHAARHSPAPSASPVSTPI